MKYVLLTAGLTIVICSSSTLISSSAGEWDLRRNVGNGACFIQPADSSPIGRLLQRHPSRVAACEDAQSRHTDDAADANKCYTYTSGTKDECKKENVTLED